MTTHFGIGQLNVRGSMPVWTHLESVAEAQGLGVLLIQDPPPPAHCMSASPWGGYEYPSG